MICTQVLAIACAPLRSLPYDDEADVEDKLGAILGGGLTFLGLVASIDPERQGVKAAIATANSATVRTVMITGDYLKTAQAIARNIGILAADGSQDGDAVDCGSLRPGGGDDYLDEPAMDALTLRVNVFARAKPEDKLEIVKSLQRQGKVCAMTGDGVNDAPALQKADIGVAMGLEGTEVAKGASDMILTDDNFCSIVKVRASPDRLGPACPVPACMRRVPVSAGHVFPVWTSRATCTCAAVLVRVCSAA